MSRIAAVNPWMLELVVVRSVVLEYERRALARDCARGLLVRVRPGVYAEAAAHGALLPEGRHLVAMRALAAVASRPPVFSHWSAAVARGLPSFRTHLDRVHITVEDASGRDLVAVASHVAALEAPEVEEIGGLLITSPARTVVDVARSAPFEVGVVMADAALRAGTPEVVLQAAVSDAAGSRGWRRAQAVVGFAKEGSGSVAESLSRVTMLRGGIRPPVLQLEVRDRRGLAGRLDFGFPWVPAGGEVDGEQKYRDAMMAPTGAADAVIAEKLREDRVRLEMPRLARWGYAQAGRTALLLPVLARVGVVPERRRITLADYSSAFASTAL